MSEPAQRFVERLGRGPLAPLHVFLGDEPLGLTEAGDALRAEARRQGADERIVLTVEPGFDWSRLASSTANLGLFGTRRLVELRLDGAKPGVDGARALGRLAERPPTEDFVVVVLGAVDADARRAKWFQSLTAAAHVVESREPPRAELGAWITRRVAGRGGTIEAAAAEELALRVEGNLLACAQAIDLLLIGATHIDAERVRFAVGDSARFRVFDLPDAALAGDAARALRVLRGLAAEGTAPVLVAHVLKQDLRALERLAAAEAQRRPLGPEERRALRIWSAREGLFRAALARHPLGAARQLLQAALRVDRILKGAERGPPGWVALGWLVARLAGMPVRSAVWAGGA